MPERSRDWFASWHVGSAILVSWTEIEWYSILPGGTNKQGVKFELFHACDICPRGGNESQQPYRRPSLGLEDAPNGLAGE